MSLVKVTVESVFGSMAATVGIMITFLLIVATFVFAGHAWKKWWNWSPRIRIIAALNVLVLLSVAIVLAPRGLILQKIIGHLVMPVGLLWLALGGTAGYFWFRRRWKAFALTIASWAALTLAGSLYVGVAWLWWLQADYRDVRPFDERPFEAILVLGGGTFQSPVGDAMLSPTGDRVMLAARMYHAGLTPVLVASGEGIEGMGEIRNSARETQEIWRSLQIPSDAIVLAEGARNTSEEVRVYQRLVTDRGWNRVGLITSAWHLRRAMRLCSTEGLRVHPLPANSFGAPHFIGLLSLIPTGDGFATVHYAAWETVGSMVGR